MLLYKYTDVSGKNIILNSRLKVNDPINFNDPFEFALYVREIRATDIKKHVFKDKDRLRYYYNEGIKKGRLNQSWKEFRRENSDPVKRGKKAQMLALQISEDSRRILNLQDGGATNFFLLCCFCGSPLRSIDEILMWSHYSDGHRGLRYWIESDLLTKNIGPLTKVEYKDHVVSLDVTGLLTGNKDYIRNVMEECCSVKSRAWEYEQEYRWFVSKNFCKMDSESNQYFVGIDLNIVKRIDFGVKSSTNMISEITKKINNLGLKIELKKAIQDKCEFKLDYIDLQ